MLTDNDYLHFYQTRVNGGDYVILDNSVIELGQPVSYESLVNAVQALRPSELVLCDFPQNPFKTLQWAFEYGPRFKEEFPDMKLMVVPQWYGSKDHNNWIASMWELAELDCVDVIGIPKFLGSERPKVVDTLRRKRPDRKEWHLLGTWENPAEVKAYEHDTWIRGVDTKAPVRLGQYGVVLHPTRGLLASMRNSIPAMEFDMASDPLPIVTEHNVKTFISWATGKELQTSW
jgi:hypothetical protein